MRIRRAIIPAAGLGARLRPLTRLMPKEMLPLGGKVVLQHVIEECDAAGLDSLLVVLNRQKTALFPIAEETPGPIDVRTNVPMRQVYFANQEKQGGLAHALLHGERFAAGEHFVVALGDTVIHGGRGDLLQRLIQLHIRHKPAVTLAVERIEDESISRYGVILPGEEVEGGQWVRGIVEKPPSNEAPSRWAITARYVLDPLIFDACRAVAEEGGGEIELTKAMSRLAEQGAGVLAVPLQPGERRMDVGSLQSYSAAFGLFADSAASSTDVPAQHTANPLFDPSAGLAPADPARSASESET